MKHLIRVVIMLSLWTNASLLLAQTSKSATDAGVFSLSGGVTFSHTTIDEIDRSESNLSVTPAISYFIIPNFSLGTSISYVRFSTERRSSSSWGIGPGIRYYLPIKELKPFVGFRYLFSKFSSGDIRDTDINLELGVDFFVAKNVAIEPFIRYHFIETRNENFDSELKRRVLRIGVGINIFIF